MTGSGGRRGIRGASLLALVVVLLAGCGAVPGLPASSGGADAAVVPVLAQSQESPEDVVNSFLDAWSRRDYPAMYTLLHTESQGRYTLPVFQTTYEDVANAIGLNNLTYRVRRTQLQGMTAAVTYDVTMTSPSFGTIEDSGRTMRLVQSPAGWRIAWSSMDIFDGLAGGSQVSVEFAPQPRGDIFDRNGNLLVEDGGTVIEVYAQRLAMFNETDCYALLGRVLRQDSADLTESAANYNLDTIFYVGDMDSEAYNLNAQALSETCGIVRDNGLIQEREDRRYVGHGAAAHVTGYVGQATEEDINRGFQPGDLIGQAGIETAYDAELRGQAARVLRITEPGGTVIRTLGGAEATPPQSVTLTIDRDLQLVTAQALADAYAYAAPSWASRSPGAGAVVVDVRSGAILALASYPTFDPGIFSPQTPFPFPANYISELLGDPEGAFFNRVVQGQYAPGSIFKIITTAAAANEHIVGRDETFYCDLQWNNGARYGDTLPVRLDWRASEPEDNRFPTGDVTISQALTSSCDPFFYEMGARLFQRDPNLLSNYARRFGLGRTFGLDVLGREAAGVIPTTDAVEEAINEAIGQGDVQVTPLQMAMAVSAIANGGTLYRPYIVQRVGVEGEPPTFEAAPEVMGEVNISDEALDIVREGMCDVTLTDAVNTTNGKPLGTAWFVFEETYYSICGKTGTAQTNREPNAWFIAYVPADNPQIAIAVMAQNSREGSEVAAPIVRRILDDYLNVPEENYLAFPDWWQDEYVPLTIAEGAPVGG